MRKYKDVLRYVYALTAIVVIAAIALMIVLFLSQRTENAARERVALYYLTSSAVAEQLYRDAQTVSLLARRDNPVSEHQGPGLSGVLFSMRTRVQQLRKLQDQYAADEFVATIERLTDHFGAIEHLPVGPESADAATARLAAFNLSVDQLRRLHQIAASEALASLEVSASQSMPNLTILAAILTVAMFVGWYVARLLRESLTQQEYTEAALAEAQERMHHMQKLEALGQLVGGVAHDFNNLLTVILGQAQLLKDQSGGDASMQQGLKDISQAGRQAAALTKQLLTFSRRQPPETQAVDLNELIRGMQPMLHRLIGEDIKLVFCYGAIRDAIELDPGQISQVILNLFINARDAMPDGGTISLTTDSVQIGPDGRPGGIAIGSYAKITVADDGAGMKKETLDRVFEPFFTTKPRGRGTGLGLATVHGIVTDANGHIFIDSAPGEGTRFEIYWPSPECHLEQSTADPAHQQTGSETILVVEDDQQIRQLLRDGLGALGYKVLTASGGAKALEICGREPDGIDVIVSDVVMPDMNGADFMKKVLPIQPGAVGIFMSGYTDDIVLQRGVGGSAIPMINKPFELDALAKLIRARLRGRVAGNTGR